MAKRKLKVVGPCEINGAQHGEITMLDDSVYNVQGLILGGHVEEVVEEPVKNVSSKSEHGSKKEK